MSDTLPLDFDGAGEISDFLVRHIRSIGQLEALLLMAAHSERAWTPELLADALRVQREGAHGFLHALAAAGLFAPTGNPDEFVYAPGASERETVMRLAEVYRERRLTITNLIYAHGAAPTARAFADSFRLKRPKK